MTIPDPSAPSGIDTTDLLTALNDLKTLVTATNSKLDDVITALGLVATDAKIDDMITLQTAANALLTDIETNTGGA